MKKNTSCHLFSRGRKTRYKPQRNFSNVLQGRGDIDPNLICFSDQEFVMNEGLEVNVAILRASTNSMSQNGHFFRDPKKNGKFLCFFRSKSTSGNLTPGEISCTSFRLVT